MIRAPVAKKSGRRRSRAAGLLIAVTAVLCLAALILRTPLCSRYWAWRLARADTLAERAAYLTALCNAGAGARWGTAALLDAAQPEVRQYGVIVLQHVQAGWARGRLLVALGDSDENVRELAALGLARGGDSSVIPVLESTYRAAGAAALGACVALERLGTPQAVAALHELAQVPADVARRAALVDALAGIAAPECVPALLLLLEDLRACAEPTRAARRAADVLRAIEGAGGIESCPALAATLPAAPTIAARAAAALERITGVSAGSWVDLSDEERRRAATRWSEWYQLCRDRQP